MILKHNGERTIENKKRVMIVAAHPDDEMLGCGGYIARYSIKQNIKTCIISSGREYEFDQKFEIRPITDWIALLEDFVEQFKPEIVFTHSKKDTNKDHVIINEATMVACRPFTTVKEIYTYESLGSTYNFSPDTYLELTEQELERKQWYMQTYYKNELREYPHPRSLEGIKIRAQTRGLEIHRKYAEAYKTLRRII